MCNSGDIDDVTINGFLENAHLLGDGSVEGVTQLIESWIPQKKTFTNGLVLEICKKECLGTS